MHKPINMAEHILYFLYMNSEELSECPFQDMITCTAHTHTSSYHSVTLGFLLESCVINGFTVCLIDKVTTNDASLVSKTNASQPLNFTLLNSEKLNSIEEWDGL